MRALLPGIALLALPFAAGAMADPPAKQLFAAKTEASRQRPAAWGGYARGCLAGARKLPDTGPTWQVMRPGRNRSWGHPVTIDFIRDLGAFAADLPGWRGLYIGDISQPRGGPMLTGHRSHQIGLDVDIWMRPARDLTLSRQRRETFPPISMRRNRGAHVNANWSRQHHAILRAAARDPRVARIFVFPGAKVQMCNDETGERRWLRKIRPWWGHHYHFHVRLKCPRGARGCVDQPPPPPGDGCSEARKWVDDILNPPPPRPRDPRAPPPKKRREYTLADLPRQCVSVLRSR